MNAQAFHRARWLAASSFLLVGIAIANYPARAQALDSTGVKAVPTYESAGLYWTGSGANATTGCEVKFRRVGDAAWTQGLSMWFDARNSECRGSLVNLVPGTHYEAQLNRPGLAATKGINFNTWSNTLPVAQVITVASGSATLNITQGGTATGYIVYQGAPGATLDGLNTSTYNVSVNASYVIVRGLTLKGAKQDAIRIAATVKDVVIEDNDISGWGRTRDGTWGTDMDSAVRAVCPTSSPSLERVTVQRNKMYNPRYPANSWSNGHPEGPQAISFSYCGGNHVFRWNEIYSTNGNHFNDAMGGEDNFSTTGFPNSDSDIYGNRISHAWDDAIEAEGGNKNVRIWGNYMDRTAIGVATTATATGPVYIFRNVWNRAPFFQNSAPDADERQPFFKSGSNASLGNGRRYVFHNTMLQATQAGVSYGLGGGAGMGGTGATQLINNTISMNNIYHLWKPNSAVYQAGTGNTFQNDMFNGSAGTAMVSGISATPSYAAGNGWQSEANGLYALAAGTPGFDAAARIVNFNDSFVGTAPDVGAAEAGAGAMKFGLAAAGVVVVPPPPAPTPPPPPPPNSGTGTTPVSTTLVSSKPTANGGVSVKFTVNLMGNSGTPTGTVNFKSNGTSISGCSSVAISRSKAVCTTSSLAAGAHSITGAYSGSTTYVSTVAGPITQTVIGAAPPPAPPPPPAPAPAPGTTQLNIDSSKYTTITGESVTFTVAITGTTPTGTVNFSDNGVSIAACAAIPVSSGVAKCTTTRLVRGSHLMRGVYSGDAKNSSGVAGPITQTVN